MLYHLHLFASTGRMVDVCEVQCHDDRDALTAAASVISVWAGVEIWCGRRVVGRFTAEEVVAVEPSQRVHSSGPVIRVAVPVAEPIPSAPSALPHRERLAFRGYSGEDNVEQGRKLVYYLPPQ